MPGRAADVACTTPVNEPVELLVFRARYLSNQESISDQISYLVLLKIYLSSFIIAFAISFAIDIVGLSIVGAGQGAMIFALPFTILIFSQIFIPFAFLYISMNLIRKGKFGFISSILLVTVLYSITIPIVIGYAFTFNPIVIAVAAIYTTVVYIIPFGAIFWFRLARKRIGAFHKLVDADDREANPADVSNSIFLVIVVEAIAFMWWPSLLILDKFEVSPPSMMIN